MNRPYLSDQADLTGVVMCRPVDPRLWTEPFLLMSAPDDDPCTVPGCRTQSKTRWQVEVIGYQGHGEAPLTGPTFTACLSHLTQQMNRFLPNGGRR